MTDSLLRNRIIERRTDGVDPEEFLVEIGAIEVTDADELAFTESFDSLLRGHVDALAEDPPETGDIAHLYAIEESHVEAQDRSYPGYKVIHTVFKWPSDAALVFDVATDRALTELSERWGDVPGRQRPRMVQALRSFQDACYFCGGSIVYAEQPVESCCSDRDVLTLHCEGCDRRFLEFRTEQGMDSIEVTSA